MKYLSYIKGLLCINRHVELEDRLKEEDRADKEYSKSNVFLEDVLTFERHPLYKSTA